MFNHDHHVSTQMCRLRDVFMHAFWLIKTHLCVTFNIQRRIFHLIFHRCPRNDVSPHDFLTYEPFSVCNFLHMKPCQRILIWMIRKDCEACSLLKDVPLRNFLTYDDVSVSNFYKEDVSICNLLRNFVWLISTDMFPRKFVDYETSSCAYSHTKRRVSAHFLTYEDMSMC